VSSKARTSVVIGSMPIIFYDVVRECIVVNDRACVANDVGLEEKVKVSYSKGKVPIDDHGGRSWSAYIQIFYSPRNGSTDRNRQSTKICMASNLIARQTVTVVYSPPCTAITARQLHTYLLTYKLRCLSIKAYYYNSNVSRHSTVKTFRSSDEDTINPFAALHAGYFRRRK